MRPLIRNDPEDVVRDGDLRTREPGLPWRHAPATGPHGPERREAARELIETTRIGLERIGLALGIGTGTLFRWKRQEGWRRLPPLAGPARYRGIRGQPYAADAVEAVRRLATGTRLSQDAIAARAGVSQATVSKWMRRRGWTRPPPDTGRQPFAAGIPTAPRATSGSRRGRPHHPATVAAARQLYETTGLPIALIAARVKVSAVTVACWAKARGWTRPRDIGFPHLRRESARERRYRLSC